MNLRVSKASLKSKKSSRTIIISVAIMAKTEVSVGRWVRTVSGLGHHGNKDLTPGTVANQYASGAKWVPVEVLEEGYGQRFGL